MKLSRLQHDWGIRKRVFFLAIVPMVLVAIVIGAYLTTVHLEFVRNSLDDKGKEVVRNLAYASEYSLLIEDRARLQSLVERALVGPQVMAITILDANGNVVAQKTRDGGVKLPLEGNDSHRFRVFAQAVVPPAASDGEFEELQHDVDTRPLGTVLVHVSRDFLAQTARDVIVRSVLVILFGLLFATLLALLLARELLLPIQRIINLVGRVQRGDLSSRLARKSGAELGELEQGINRMVRTIEGAQHELEVRVANATRQLQDTVAVLKRQNIALERSRHETIAAGQAKERFLAHVSHELRTPLNAVVGFAQLLNEASEEERREYTRVINNASQQLVAVIDDVLSYSGLQEGSLKIDSVIFNTLDLLDDAVSLLSHEAHLKGLELVLLVHRDTPKCVIGDPVRFSQVLTNLLINAVKFTREGEVLVISEAYRDSAGNPWLQVIIEDTGIGIAPDLAEHLFEPFVQGDSSIKKKYGGTGLGLAVSRALMEKLGGRIWYEPRRGGGSRFGVHLPAAAAKAEQHIADHFQNALSGRKSLVYDSHAFSRRAIKNTLLYFGMQVFTMRSQSEIERKLATALEAGEPFDVVVVGGKSDEFPETRIGRFRRIARSWNVKIVMLISSEVEVPKKQRWLTDMPDMVVSSKPIRRQRFFEALQQVLKEGRSKAAIPRKKLLPKLPQRKKASSKCALIADDNAFSRKLLETYLWGEDVEVVTVENGYQLVETASKSRFDIIFLDIHMPELDGIAAAEKIRKSGKNKNTPLVSVTADPFTVSGNDGKVGIFDAALFKPVAQKDIRALLKRFFNLQANLEKTPDISAEAGIGREEFIRALKAEIENLSAAAARMARSTIRETAHQINGLTGYFGEADLQQNCRELEEIAETADEEHILVLVETVVSAVSRL